MTDTILTMYPVSRDFRIKMEPIIASDAPELTITELRQLRPMTMVRKLWTLKPDRIVIAIEDATSRSLLPVLYIIAMLSRPQRIVAVLENLETSRVSNVAVLKSAVMFVIASAKNRLTIRRARKDVDALRRLERVQVAQTGGSNGLFLNGNLWFGVKAGGSVGHISGVANGFWQQGRQMRFASAGGRLLVKPEIDYLELRPARFFGVPWEANLYRFNYDVVRQVKDELTARPTDFIYQRMSISNFSGVVVSRQMRLPLIIEYNGSEAWVARNWGRELKYQKLAEDAEAVCLSHAHMVVTISDVLREELIDRGVPEHRIVTYPNCIDPEMIDPDRFSLADRNALRARYGIAPDALVVTFLGTFGQWHGAEILGKAIRILCDRHADSILTHKLHFLFVGNGLKMPNVKEALGAHATGPYVTFTGIVAQSDAPLHLSASDIFTSPHVANADGSRFFGSPTKLFEYLAMERAIIASNIDQIGQILEGSLTIEEIDGGGVVEPDETDQSVALLVSPGDASALARAILYLAERPTWRAAISARARSLALRKYTWQHHVQAISDGAKRLGLIT